MNRKLVAPAVLAVVAVASIATAAAASPLGAPVGEPPGRRVEHRSPSGGPVRVRTPNLSYHGGRILPAVASKAIYWGPSWSDPAFVADKITGLDAFYAGHNGSRYADTVNEYTDTVGGGHRVSSTLVHEGSVVDTSPASAGTSNAAILAEVQKQVTAGAIVPDPAGNGFYPVYTDVKRGSAGYCAWHGGGKVTIPSGRTRVVQFAFFFDLSGDAGCDPGDTTTGHSQALAALANLSAHELEEARSDPDGASGWFDAAGEENADKCGWTFNVPSVTLSNGTSWRLQGEWSNAAYLAGTGYPNAAGQRGCVDGH